MIEVIRRVRKARSVWRILSRTGASLALIGLAVSLAILLSGCACPPSEAYCPPAFTAEHPRL